jgi:2-polyprenyl-3-methyl-5-hydroxy-6-metoxy-1,4-benzoquinol methylase
MNTPLFDDEIFFAEYKRLRERPDSYNALLEQPALLALLPPVADKRVLDLGCGFGEVCREFERRGARSVLGLDAAEKMLAEARRLTDSRVIQYLVMDLNDLSGLKGIFDLVTSSLAIHYVPDFPRLVETVWNRLAEGGHFLFSQEHPLTTAPLAGPDYFCDESGRPLHYKLTDYGREGFRRIHWFIDDVKKEHRTFSSLINALVRAGFLIEEMAEPRPTEAAMALNPGLAKEFHKPSFLIIRARKPLPEAARSADRS